MVSSPSSRFVRRLTVTPCVVAASLKSETSTLNDAKDTKGEVAKKEGSTLGPSSTSFAKKAKEQGWAAPTAARPSFGG